MRGLKEVREVSLMRRVDLRRVERSMAWIGVDWEMDAPKTVDALTTAGDERELAH